MELWGQFLCAFVLLFKFSDANFNLFLTEEEVKRILGLDAELYYVREGVVNEYAMGWNVKIPPEIHTLYFRWEALTKRPVLYNVAVWVNETRELTKSSPLAPPQVNVSLSGTVPKKTSTFQLELPCTGLVSAEVDVIMNLNVTSGRSTNPPTVIYLKRRKICLKGISSRTFSSHQDLSLEEMEKTREKDESTEDDSTFLLYLSCGAVSLAFVLGVISGVAIWRKKIYEGKMSASLSAKDNRNLLMGTDTSDSKTTIRTKPSISSPDKAYHSTMATSTLPTSISINSYASLYKPPLEPKRLSEILPQFHPASPQGSDIYESSCCSGSNSSQSIHNFTEEQRIRNSFLNQHSCHCSLQRDCDSRFQSNSITTQDNFKPLEMERQRVRVTEVVQEGVKGRLYKGWLQREHPELDQQVLVKTLRDCSDVEEVSCLCREGTKLAKLRHSNLLTLVGLSIIGNAPPFLVYPDPVGCNFNLFLKSKSFPLKMNEIVDISTQASKAISFLHSNKIVHEDISARNCILCDNFQIRVTDSALSRDFFPEDYENHIEMTDSISCIIAIRGNRLPVRWMAPEAISDCSQISFASDVWSLGVFLWEMCSQGERPYACISSTKVLPFLREEHRLRQPPTCPDELFRLMSACWSAKPQQRPSAQEVNEFLASFKRSLKDFV